MRFHRYRSPIGNLILAADNGFLCYCLWEDSMDKQLLNDWEEDKITHDTVLTEACRQMEEYFSGTRKSFSLPLKPIGTVFQQPRLASITEDSLWQNYLLRRRSKTDEQS